MKNTSCTLPFFFAIKEKRYVSRDFVLTNLKTRNEFCYENLLFNLRLNQPEDYRNFSRIDKNYCQYY